DEQFGIQMDGSGDLNGDGLSDIIAGSSDGQHAYLYFGVSGNFAPSAPSVTFSGNGTTVLFGFGVAAIGDIDSDGREDLAISDPAAEKIYIYKGRSSWLPTLGPGDADYVVVGDSTYATSGLGIS